MESRLFLDTHVLIWMYQKDLQEFSPRGLEQLRSQRLVYSPMVELELQFLHEVGRLSVGPAPVLSDLSAELGLQPCGASHLEVVRVAVQQIWTRDPFDRLIVAHACLRNEPLLTRDRHIRQHYDKAFW